MSEVLLMIGRYSVYTLSFFVVLAFFWYGFVIYKKGGEYRYAPESLLDLCVLSGLFGWIGARIGFVVSHLAVFQVNWLRIFLLPAYPGYDFFGLLIGLAIGVGIISRRGEIKASDGFDLLGLGLPGAMAIERLGRVLAGQVTLIFGVPIEIFQAFVFLVIFVWLWKIEGEYRTFEWYRFRKTQARSGFVFGAFLVFSGIAIVSGAVLLKQNPVLMGLSAGTLIAGMLIIYSQSGRSLAHDVKLLPFVKRWYTKSK